MISFQDILSSNVDVQKKCLEKLVEDVHEKREETTYNFLNDTGSEDFLWYLITLLSSDDTRTASNAAYVIGTFAETDLGSQRIFSIIKGRTKSSVIQDLYAMLKEDDNETIMNAAGMLGTLAETEEGRLWMLSQQYIDETMSRVTDLLSFKNIWVASNAALVLARLSISKEGCLKILSHELSTNILTKLIYSLGNDIAGRGMNAAFAIGRLLDIDDGKERLLQLSETKLMITTLCKMLCKGDEGSAKNACFAISCLSSDVNGNQKVIQSNFFNDVISKLILLLASNEDAEATWFAAMTVRVLSSHQWGVRRLRDNKSLMTVLIDNLNKSGNTTALNDEITKVINNLKQLDPPAAPAVTMITSTTAMVTWDKANIKSEATVVYELFEGSKTVYKGKETQVQLKELNPNSNYSYKLRVSVLDDESPFSSITSITTDEGIPYPPTHLRVIGTTYSQIRISWLAPKQSNGQLKGYAVYIDDKFLQCTSETSFIVMRLQPASTYHIQVKAQTSSGFGQPASVQGKTQELVEHVPNKPTVTVIGRNEAHVTWKIPIMPIGRIFRYELIANKDVIYSGTDRNYYATNLIPDKEYLFSVCAITNEGRCESNPTKIRTFKDKSQVEPGRHASKTHSFKAKEFQFEKCKTQLSIAASKRKPRPQNLSFRLNSCTSTPSHRSFDEFYSPQFCNQGASYTSHNQVSLSTDTTGNDPNKNNFFDTKVSSVILKPNLLKVKGNEVTPHKVRTRTVKLADKERIFYIEISKQNFDQLKIPSKDYWSDNDMSFFLKKKNADIITSQYQTFKQAHRPSKIFRLGSPLISEKLQSNLSLGGEKYNFFPIELRAQSSNLPKLSLQEKKLESFLHKDLRYISLKQHIQPQRSTSHRHVSEHHPIDRTLLSNATMTNNMNQNLTNTFQFKDSFENRL